jgi:RNA-binding protein
MSSSVFQRKDIPVVNIGKKGLDEAVLEEIKNVLKARGIVKVKLLKNFREAYGLSPEEAAVVLSQRLSAEIVGVRGFVIVLKKAIRGH